MFLFALKDSLEYFGERRTDKSQSSKFQGVETPSQVTTSHQKLFVVKTSNHYDEQLHVAETQKHGSNTTAFFTCEATVLFFFFYKICNIATESCQVLAKPFLGKYLETAKGSVLQIICGRFWAYL